MIAFCLIAESALIKRKSHGQKQLVPPRKLVLKYSSSSNIYLKTIYFWCHCYLSHLTECFMACSQYRLCGRWPEKLQTRERFYVSFATWHGMEWRKKNVDSPLSWCQACSCYSCLLLLQAMKFSPLLLYQHHIFFSQGFLDARRRTTTATMSFWH